MPYDVIIIGGGPAGLSAALILGRCRRRVVVCDAGRPRNSATAALHGYLSRDGINPCELLRLGRSESARYGVEFIDARVLNAQCVADDQPGKGSAFDVQLEDGRTLHSRKLLLATGVMDILPPIEGIRQFYGKSVHHCPYCDGWEHRDEPIAAYGGGQKAAGLALSLRTWSDHVTACTDGHPLDRADVQQLKQCGIALREQRMLRLEGTGGQLERIVFADGQPLECRAMFFNTDQVQRSELPQLLGCEYDPEGHVRTSTKQQTPVSGLFLAGDADGDVQFVIVAAAEGATAGVAINRELQEEDRA